MGATGNDCAAGDLWCGSAYVFRFNGTSWVEQQKLAASDAAADARFGDSVSIDDSTAVVGAFRDDCAAGEVCGSAYLFRFNGSSWIEKQKLAAPNAGEFDQFGVSVSLSGEVAFVGANQSVCTADINNRCGSMHVFDFDVPCCGDGTVDPGEECDDGDTDDTDFCLSTCQVNTAIPAVSDWGLIITSLLLLSGGTVFIARRRLAPGAAVDHR